MISKQTRVWGVVLSVAALGMAAPGTVRAQPIASAVTPDALVYAEWAGIQSLNGQYQRSNLRGFIETAKLPALFAAVRSAATSIAAQQQPEAAFAVAAMNQLAAVTWYYPTAVHVSLDRRTGDPRLAVIWRAGPHNEQLLSRLKQTLARESGQGPPMTASQIGDAVVLAMNQDPTRVLPSDPAAPTLAKSPAFKRCLQQTQPKPACVLFVDVERLVAGIDRWTRDQSASGAAQWAAARDALGLAEFKRFMASGRFGGTNWVTASYIEAPAQRHGLLAALDGPRLSAESLAVVPLEATWVKAVSFDVGRLYDLARLAIKQFDANAAVQFEQAVALAKSATGLDIKTDVIDAFGPHWIAYSNSGASGKGSLDTQIVVVNTLADPDKAVASLTQLERLAVQTMGAQTGGTPGLAVNVRRVGRVDVHQLTSSKGSLEWAVHDGWLFMSGTAGGVNRALQHVEAGGKSVLDQPGVASLRKKFNSLEVKTVSFTDLPKAAVPTYQSVRSQWPVLQMVLGQQAPALRRFQLPPVERITPFLTQAVEIGWTDQLGYHSRSISPFPGSQMLGPEGFSSAATAGLGAAIAAPALAASPAQAQGFASRSVISNDGVSVDEDLSRATAAQRRANALVADAQATARLLDKATLVEAGDPFADTDDPWTALMNNPRATIAVWIQYEKWKEQRVWVAAGGMAAILLLWMMFRGRRSGSGQATQQPRRGQGPAGMPTKGLLAQAPPPPAPEEGPLQRIPGQRF